MDLEIYNLAPIENSSMRWSALTFSHKARYRAYNTRAKLSMHLTKLLITIFDLISDKITR